MPQLPADNPAPLQQSRTVLLATDNKNSILAEVAGGEPNPIAYSVYGQQSAQQDVATTLGFNGGLREAQLGWYLLGNGYRAYNPTLMRFHSPDSWSPFGRGGLNAYMYCVGDPINHSDPTGHSIWKAMKLFYSENMSFTGASQLSINARHAQSVAATSGRYAAMQPLAGARTTPALVTNASSSDALVILGIVSGAPGPRNGLPRQTSYNYGLPSPPGYVAGAAASGVTAATLGRPRSSSLGGLVMPSTTQPSGRRLSREIVSRNDITHIDRNGVSVTRPRQPVRGGNDGRVNNTSAGTSSTSRHPLSDAEHERVEYNTWLRVRGAQLQRQGYTSPSFIAEALRWETPAELRRIRTEIGVRRQGSGH